MSVSVSSAISHQHYERKAIWAAVWIWLPIAIGLLFLYVPTYLDVADSVWAVQLNTQGPVLLMLALFLVWRDRYVFVDFRPSMTAAICGWALVVLGGVLYALGRSEEFLQLEAGSQVPMVMGVMLVVLGKKAVRTCWFLFLMLVMVIPVPNSMLDEIMLPLKRLVSTVVAQLLYTTGLPIARDGVVLYVGNYQLMIADACSGLNSMIALAAVGLFYVYLVGRRRWETTTLLLLSILPIAFIANLARVSGLVLITYWFGEQVGKRFHNNAGYLEILIAFSSLFAIDWILGRLFVAKEAMVRNA